MPTPPSAVGCYVYNNSIQAWKSVVCMTGETGPGSEVPTEGGSSGLYGVGATSSIESAWGDASVSTFSGESDSVNGSNSYSVQLNTNIWQTSGVVYWDQFTIQNAPTTHHLFRTCIWQIDVSTASYGYDCVPYPSTSLFDGYFTIFNATVKSGDINFEMELYNGSYSYYSVSQSDEYGLASHWVNATGPAILGVASGSTADFTSPAKVYTDTGIARFTSASGVEGGTGNYDGYGYSTAEMNNLGYSYAVYDGCSSNICYEDTISTH